MTAATAPPPSLPAGGGGGAAGAAGSSSAAAATPRAGSAAAAHLAPGSSGLLLQRGASAALARHGSVLAPVDAASKQSDAYISELLSYSLERLRKEPELLLEERQHVERAVQSSALSHYTAFIDTAQCLGVVQQQLAAAADGLGALSQAVPELAGAFDGFAADAARVTAQHAANKQLLGQQATLLELLDAPSLMDTCVRNGVYDEALDLAAFVSRVALLHPELPVVRLLADQAAAVGRAMLAQLLGRLRGPVQLPECLRVVGHLRRMAAFPEQELRLQFLRCREAWLNGVIAELDDDYYAHVPSSSAAAASSSHHHHHHHRPAHHSGDGGGGGGSEAASSAASYAGDAYEYVKHLTDAHRLHLFDVVMQYRAIFFDGTGGGGSSGLSSTTTGSGAAAAAAAGGRDGGGGAGGAGSSGVLYTWVQHRLRLYLAALQERLPLVAEGASLAAAMEHCLYCCASLARVGLDFSALLPPLFQACALRLLRAKLAVSVAAFHQRLDAHKWIAMPSPVFKQAAAAAAAAGGAAGGADGGSGAAAGGAAGAAEAGAAAAAGDSLAPPYALMEHGPLAVFVNGVLSALNELRHCAMLPLAAPAGALLQGALEQVAAALAHYRQTRPLATDGERALFDAAARALGDVVVPYLGSCLARVFPPAAGGAGGGGAGGGAGGAGGLLSPAAVLQVLADAHDPSG